MSLDQFFKRIDARYRIPRPANALHLDAYQAGFRLLRDTGEGLALVASGVATALVLWKIADILLPGLDAETAQYAAKRIGRTTVLQHSVVDATGDVYDQDRLSETGRDLLDAAELRQMAEHTQAVAIIGSAPPVRFGFPRCAKIGPLAHPLPREIAQPVSLADAETAFANRKMDETEKTQDEPATSEVSPMPDLDGDYVEEDEPVIPQDPILFPLIEERQLGRSQASPSVPLSPAPVDAVLKRINEKEAPA